MKFACLKPKYVIKSFLTNLLNHRFIINFLYKLIHCKDKLKNQKIIINVYLFKFASIIYPLLHFI